MKAMLGEVVITPFMRAMLLGEMVITSCYDSDAGRGVHDIIHESIAAGRGGHHIITSWLCGFRIGVAMEDEEEGHYICPAR